MTDLSNLSEVLPLALGSSVVGGLMTATISGLRASADLRREGYARATRALVARAEYPYRIRRRASDSPDTLAALVALGHDIQEQLAASRVWVATEDARTGRIYQSVLAQIDTCVAPAAQDAWGHTPIQHAHEMNLGTWGPGSQDAQINSFCRAAQRRFGIHRVVPSRLHHLGRS